MVLKRILIIQIIIFIFYFTNAAAESTYDQTLDECFGTYDFTLYSNKEELHIDTDYLDGWFSTLWPTYVPIAFMSMVISLGTYNVSSYTCMTTNYPVNLVAAFYIEKNYDNLALDAAKGEGVHLLTLAQILGCNKKYIEQFNFEIKNNYKNIFGDIKKSSPFVLNKTIVLINSNKLLLTSCVNV